MDQQEAALSMPALVTGFFFFFLVTVSSHLPVIVIVVVVGDGGGKLNSTSEDKRSQGWWEVAPGSLGLASLCVTKTKPGALGGHGLSGREMRKARISERPLRSPVFFCLP